MYYNFGEDVTPPILRAAYEGDAHALRRAIADGADLHVEDEENYTALHWLVNNTPQGNDELRIACISALLDAGADVNRLGGLSAALRRRGRQSRRLRPLRARPLRAPRRDVHAEAGDW